MERVREVNVSMSAVETARDITFVGTGEDEFVRGKPGMAAREAGYF